MRATKTISCAGQAFRQREVDMATYTYKPNWRLIAASKDKDGKVTVLDLGKFDKDGKLSTTAAAKVAALNRAIGVTSGKAVAGSGL